MTTPYTYAADSDNRSAYSTDGSETSIRIYHGSMYMATVSVQRNGTYTFVDSRNRGKVFGSRNECRMYLYQRYGLCSSVAHEA